jgi:integration host factor subunit alpha
VKKPFGDSIMTLTKEKLVESVNNHAGDSKNTSIKLIESLLEIMKSTLESGEDVLISGFGKFCVKDKNERRGRNPATGNDLTLGARRVVIFRCSNVLRNKLNGNS